MTPTRVDRYRFRAGIALIIASIDYVDRTLPNLARIIDTASPSRFVVCAYVQTLRRSGRADLSVDPPAVVHNYRAAQAIAVNGERGEANTEELRKAVVHYRALFDELLRCMRPCNRHA
jgi:hypothetical protein